MCRGDRLAEEETIGIETKHIGSLEEDYLVVFEGATIEKTEIQESIRKLLVQSVYENRLAFKEAKKERKADRKENRKWRWVTLILGAVIAILVSIFTPVIISMFFH
jgi:hypothetical protein